MASERDVNEPKLPRLRKYPAHFEEGQRQLNSTPQ